MADLIILHIGGHKTGSTAIQHRLWKYRNKLLEAGILYPDTGRPSQEGIQYGHHQFPWLLGGRRGFRPDLIDTLNNEIECSKASSVVISSEEFDALNSEQVSRFVKQLCKPLKVFFYVRRQSEVVQGLYGTDIVWNREKRDILEYAESFRSELDYLKLVNRWAAEIGDKNVVVRPYMRESFTNGDVVSDFIRTLHLPEFTLNSEIVIESNISLPWFAAKTVQNMWRIGLSPETIYSSLPALAAICRGADKTYQFFSPAQAAAFDRKFEESNRQFHTSFFPSIKPFLWSDVDVNDEWPDARRRPYAALRAIVKQIVDYVDDAEKLKKRNR